MLRAFFSQDLYIVLLLFCLIAVVTVKQLFGSRFNDFLVVFWNNRYLKLYNRERKKVDIFNLLLFINFVVMASLFCLTLHQEFNSAVDRYNILILALVAVGITSILILKYLIERLIAQAFDFLTITKNYTFYKATHKNLSGLLLLAINILLLFSQLHKKPVVYVAITVFLLINISGFIRFLKVYQKVITAHIFYFLLYLCALEIGPYVILYKVFKDYFV